MPPDGGTCAAAPDREPVGQVDGELADLAPTDGEGEIDRALEMTFPASDPPSWMAAGGRSSKNE